MLAIGLRLGWIKRKENVHKTAIGAGDPIPPSFVQKTILDSFIRGNQHSAV